MSPPRLHRILVLLAAMTLGSCSAPTDTGTITDNALARQRWASERPAAYDYTLSVSCFCIQDVTRPVVIVVNGTSVVSRTYADTGAPVPAQWATTFPSIDGLFEKIASATAAHAATLDVTYDATRGFPTHIAIDYVAQIADDEIVYTIRDFHSRPTN